MEALSSRLRQQSGAEGEGPAAGALEFELEQELEHGWAQATQAWPGLVPHASRFAEHVAEILGSEFEPPLGLGWSDLGLAFLAAEGDPRAVEELRRRARRIAVRVCARSEGPDLDELLFEVEGKLFDPTGSKLKGYSGAGELDGWLAVLTTRAWLNLRRDRGREQLVAAPDEVLGAPGSAWLPGVEFDPSDPELAYLKQLYRQQFRDAFERAALALGADERNVLRAYYGLGQSIDVIAAGRGMHRATAARRVNHARERLLAETRRLLLAELALSRGDLESVMRLIQSQLHITLSRIFAEPAEVGEEQGES